MDFSSQKEKKLVTEPASRDNRATPIVLQKNQINFKSNP